jgi:hypothetical protein
MALTKLSLGGNNNVIYKLFTPRESLVSDILAGDGNIEKLFYGVFCTCMCTFVTIFAFDSAYHLTHRDLKSDIKYNFFWHLQS